jgi:hypothetical protein
MRRRHSDFRNRISIAWPLARRSFSDRCEREPKAFDLSASLEWETMSLTHYANNLLDENSQLSFDRERGGRARLGYAIGQPRTIGLTARRSF